MLGAHTSPRTFGRSPEFQKPAADLPNDLLQSLDVKFCTFRKRNTQCARLWEG